MLFLKQSPAVGRGDTMNHQKLVNVIFVKMISPFNLPPNQCDQIWQNFDTLAKISKTLAILTIYFVFCKILNLLWQLFMLLGEISSLKMAQCCTIWSHCPNPSYDLLTASHPSAHDLASHSRVLASSTTLDVV